MSLGGSAAASEARPATWTLEDYQQTGCYSPNVHDHYYAIYIDGTWRRQIYVGAAHLPEGGTYDTSYAPIPPGSSNGEYTLAYVHVTLPSTEPVGTYDAYMWASTGRTTQSVPITLEVKSSCGY
jgi:hypothetical protein